MSPSPDVDADPAVPLVASSSKHPFTQSQCSLALALTKFRLKDSSTSDFIQHLRKKVKTTSSHSVLDGEHRYVDSVEFWKDQYTRVHEEKKDLQDKVHRREEELRVLKLAQDQDDPDTRPAIPQQLMSQYSDMPLARKRKEPSSDDILSGLDPPAMWNEEATFMAPADVHLLRMRSFLVRLGRERKNLDKSNERLQDPNHHGDVLKHFNGLLALLENALCDSCMPLKFYNDNEELQKSHTFKLLRQLTWQVYISFQSCFTTLNEICRTIPGRSKRSPIIYGMVQFVKNSLALLHNLSKKQAEHQKIIGSSKRSKGSKPEEYAVNVYLTCTITSIIWGMDWEVNKPGHSELLEGIMFAVLEHTGRLMSVASFGGHIAASKNRGPKVSKTPTIDTTYTESLYATQILYAALGGADKKELFLKVLMTGRVGSRASRQPKDMRMLDKAKHLLQSTLVKYMVGVEHLETLRMPEPPVEKMDISKIEHKGVAPSKDWLVSMVANLVGWDLVMPK
ncbi:hypothetical protein HYALB_00011141 [Hymenoscyphus albidus]|uniref:Uncharacterized protein n=1 Tax=Hymenoscyphus albidus TaxID=595503 RepID=A0A9N9LNB9_9HELO|nr:hypothetical protein HYALB_00011141 [Hymenoscyphus albidus]